MARRVPDAPVTARPAPEDSRVEVRKRLVVCIHDALCPYADCREDPQTYPAGEFAAADGILAKFLVLDPSSEALVERIAGDLEATQEQGWSARAHAESLLAAISSGNARTPSRCLRQSVNPTGRGLVVEGYRADCTCGWRTTTTSRADADARADAHAALAAPGGERA
jgi:hypothetical protein